MSSVNAETSIRTIDKVNAGLKRRHRSERRFRQLGLAAIIAAVLFLALLFISIIANGYTAFVQTWYQLEVRFDAERIDPQGDGTEASLSAGDYSGMVKDSIRQQYPWVKKRRDKRSLYALISSGAAFQLRNMVMENPSLVGTTRKVWVQVDDDADMFYKGHVTAIKRNTYHSSLELEIDGKAATIKTGHHGLEELRSAVRSHQAKILGKLRRNLERKKASLRKYTQELAVLKLRHQEHIARDRHEGAKLVEDDINELLDKIKSYEQEISMLEQEIKSAADAQESGKMNLPPSMASYLVHTGGAYIRIVSADSNQAEGEVLLPPSEPVPMVAATWELIELKTPQQDRRVRDKQAAILMDMQDKGLIEKRFNTTFFTAGDSREPELAGIWSAAKGSMYALIVTLLLSFPIGVAAAVYLEEFAPQNRWTDMIEVNINNLAAVPSIVFGLLGLAVFINFFGLPRSAPLVGGLVLTLMTLPTIIIASRAALKSVPPSIREAALGIGASRVQTIFFHVLPLALPGMLTGTIIGMAQALGESAPLLMIGMVAFIVDIPQGFTDPATALPVQIYLWADSPERAFVERTSAAIMVLLTFLVMMNAFAVVMRKRFERRW